MNPTILGLGWPTVLIGVPAVILASVISNSAQAAAPRKTVVEIKMIAPNKPYPLTVKALAEKWGPIFGVDPSWIITLSYIESSYIPTKMNPRAKTGAWGLMQIKFSTALDLLRRLKKAPVFKNERVQKCLKAYWRGQDHDLLNPDLNIMLAAYYLATIRKEFGDDFEKVAAAYNQGPGNARKALKNATAASTPFASNLASEGQKYVAMAFAAREKGYA